MPSQWTLVGGGSCKRRRCAQVRAEVLAWPAVCASRRIYRMMVLGDRPQDLGHGVNAVLLLDQTGQRHAAFRLELLVTPGWSALHLRTFLGGRCCIFESTVCVE